MTNRRVCRYSSKIAGGPEFKSRRAHLFYLMYEIRSGSVVRSIIRDFRSCDPGSNPGQSIIPDRSESRSMHILSVSDLTGMARGQSIFIFFKDNINKWTKLSNEIKLYGG